MKYINIIPNEKFTDSFIKFIKYNFLEDEHFFLILGEKEYIKIKNNENILITDGKVSQVISHIKIILKLYRSKKIILHGLLNRLTIITLFFNPWLLKKSFWVIWGGDLYNYKTRNKSSILKRNYYKIEDYVKKNMTGYITHIEGDYRLAKEWYGAGGKYYNCFMYLSNIYNETPKILSNKDGIYVQIGNSADPSNNHLEILDKLRKYKDANIKLFCPLSYGDKLWANEVIKYGKDIFGEKFIPITDFMKFENYMEFISKIDIAIFAHDRQQAVGNITSLLGMEKTVYLKKEVTTYDMLKDLGVKVGDFSELNNLDLFSIEDRKKNKEIIKERFSEKRLLEDLKEIFDN